MTFLDESTSGTVGIAFSYKSVAAGTAVEPGGTFASAVTQSVANYQNSAALYGAPIFNHSWRVDS